MAISSRIELKEYCLRRLGDPVIQINVDDQQVEDRLDDALQFFSMYDFDGVENLLLKYQLTASDLTNKYISVPDTVMVIKRVFPIDQTGLSSSMFNVKYQFMMNEVWNFTNTGMLNFVMSMQYVNLMNDMLNGLPQIRWNRYQNQLHIDTDWTYFQEGQYILIECIRILDPETYTKLYDDYFLKKYATALIKRQWGENLSKYQGIQMLGGVTMNGDKIFSDAVSEIEKIEEEIHSRGEFPVDFFCA